MDQNELAPVLRGLLIKHSRLALTEIKDDDRLATDLGFDSFAMLNVVLDLEDRFAFEVDASRLANLRDMTFADFESLVRSELASRAATGGAA